MFMNEGVTPQIVRGIQNLLNGYSGRRELVRGVQQIQRIVRVFTNLCILKSFVDVSLTVKYFLLASLALYLNDINVLLQSGPSTYP